MDPFDAQGKPESNQKMDSRKEKKSDDEDTSFDVSFLVSLNNLKPMLLFSDI